MEVGYGGVRRGLRTNRGDDGGQSSKVDLISWLMVVMR